MSEFADEPVEQPADYGAVFVLMRFFGAFVALSGGSGLGLMLSGAHCPASVSQAAWMMTAWVAVTLAGLSAAVGAWWPRPALKIAAVWLLLGLVAALFAPRLQESVERGRQGRTVTEMRLIAAAIETERSEAGSWPASMRGLERLARESQGRFALVDGWGTPFRYERDGERWFLTAACRCGKFDAATWSDYASGWTKDFRADLVMSDRGLERFPWFGNAQQESTEPPPR